MGWAFLKYYKGKSAPEISTELKDLLTKFKSVDDFRQEAARAHAQKPLFEMDEEKKPLTEVAKELKPEVQHKSDLQENKKETKPSDTNSKKEKVEKRGEFSEQHRKDSKGART